MLHSEIDLQSHMDSSILKSVCSPFWYEKSCRQIYVYIYIFIPLPVHEKKDAVLAAKAWPLSHGL